METDLLKYFDDICPNPIITKISEITAMNNHPGSGDECADQNFCSQFKTCEYCETDIIDLAVTEFLADPRIADIVEKYSHLINIKYIQQHICDHTAINTAIRDHPRIVADALKYVMDQRSLTTGDNIDRTMRCFCDIISNHSISASATIGSIPIIYGNALVSVPMNTFAKITSMKNIRHQMILSAIQSMVKIMHFSILLTVHNIEFYNEYPSLFIQDCFFEYLDPQKGVTYPESIIFEFESNAVKCLDDIATRFSKPTKSARK